MNPKLLLALGAIAVGPMFAQSSTPVPSAAPGRVIGVLPNYRTAELRDPFSPLSVKRKFYIGYKDSTDYPVFILAAGLAGLSQARGAHEGLGPGFKGYGKRLGASIADQTAQNFLTEAVMPSLFRQDPRYFRRGAGNGGVWSRAGYAASRVFVAKNDHGNWTFNAGEVTGTAMSAALGNAYYPGERRLGDNINRFSSQLAIDALGQILKEFWPDIKQKYLTRKPKP